MVYTPTQKLPPINKNRTGTSGRALIPPARFESALRKTDNLKTVTVMAFKWPRATFYVLLTVILVIILGNWQSWRTILFYVFISILYMFRATSRSSSGESIVWIQSVLYHSVSVTVSCACRKKTEHETVTDTEWHIPEVLLIKLILLMMSMRLLETCREFK
jgi:hypothetical protein